MATTIHGLACPQCGQPQPASYLTVLQVTIDLDGLLRFSAEGICKHRCQS